MNERDEEEEEEKKRSKSRVLWSLSHKYVHTDGLSFGSLYKASAYIFFSFLFSFCLYFVSKRGQFVWIEKTTSNAKKIVSMIRVFFHRR